MRAGFSSRHFLCLVASLALAVPSCAQQTPDKQTSGTFRWIDFHDPKDQNIVAWIERSLQVEKWTSIREIGVVYDAALVVTTEREGPQSPPSDDSFTVWNASLTSHVVAPLLKGVNLRWIDWENFADDAPAGVDRALRQLPRLRRQHVFHELPLRPSAPPMCGRAGSAAAREFWCGMPFRPARPA